MCVDQPDFMRIVLLTEFLTHILQRKSRTMQQVLQGFGTIYIEGHRRVLHTYIRNHDRHFKHCVQCSCGFCFDFSFHLVFTLNLTRFGGCVFKVFFGFFIHCKVLSLSVFKIFLRIFVFRFIRAFRSASFGMELS
jgi:hypothetical protein